MYKRKESASGVADGTALSRHLKIKIFAVPGTSPNTSKDYRSDPRRSFSKNKLAILVHNFLFEKKYGSDKRINIARYTLTKSLAPRGIITTSYSHAASQRVSCPVLLLRKRLPGLDPSSLTPELPSHKLLIS